MKEIDAVALKKIQLDVLDAIHDYCTTNGLKYSLSCGTLLGAARHKGYIPWDDDIDIYMYRDDYNRLVKSFPELYKNRYKIVCLERDKDWDRTSAKAYDINTDLQEPGSTYPLGVNIDIFPIDDVPDNDAKWQSFDSFRRKMCYLLSFRRYANVSPHRAFYKNLVIRVLKCITSCRQLSQIIDKYIQRNNGKGYKRCFESCTALIIRNPFTKELFDDLVLLPFEDREYYAFADYDTYLTSAYGDWRQLPPKEKQVSHHTFKAYWK